MVSQVIIMSPDFDPLKYVLSIGGKRNFQGKSERIGLNRDEVDSRLI